MSELLRTLHRDPIPHNWSYPVGAEMLSRALAGLQQFSQIDLFFYHTAGRTLSSIAPGRGGKHFERTKSYPSPYDYNRLITVKWIENKWGLWIHSVPREERAAARRLIESFALNELYAWLDKKRPATWYEGAQFFEVAEHKTLPQLIFRETHNGVITNAVFVDIPVDEATEQ